MIDCVARGWPAPVPTLVTKPPSSTVTQHHSPSTMACCNMLIGNGGRCWARKCVELKIRVSVA